MFFTSAFAQMVDPANHRADNGLFAGPLFDMGPYPINATRYLFEAEPVEVVSAVATRHPQAGLGADVDDTVAVTLRFPGDRLAQFTCSYHANAIDSFIVAGTKGSIAMNPAYTFGKSLEQNRTIGEHKTHESFKATDQFGGEMRYFSDCILNGTDPEPDGEEALADLRVIEGIARWKAAGRSRCRRSGDTAGSIPTRRSKACAASPRRRRSMRRIPRARRGKPVGDIGRLSRHSRPPHRSKAVTPDGEARSGRPWSYRARRRRCAKPDPSNGAPSWRDRREPVSSSSPPV